MSTLHNSSLTSLFTYYGQNGKHIPYNYFALDYLLEWNRNCTT